MTTAVDAPTPAPNGGLVEGDRVHILDAPSWCRRYFAGKVGRVVRTLPFSDEIWVRFERPVAPWCDRMDAVEEFPFAPEQLAAA